MYGLERGAVNGRKMQSPWTEVMKGFESSPQQEGVNPNDEVPSTSSDGESGTSRSKSPGDGHQMSWVACSFSRAGQQPPQTEIGLAEVSPGEGDGSTAAPGSLAGPEGVKERAISEADEERRRSSAKHGHLMRGSSTTDTERRSSALLSQEGLAGKEAPDGGKNGKECVFKKGSAMVLHHVSPGGEDHSLTGNERSPLSRTASRPARSWEAGCGTRQRKKFLDPRELLTSDSEEEASLDTSASDSLLLESLVGLLGHSQSSPPDMTGRATECPSGAVRHGLRRGGPSLRRPSFVKPNHPTCPHTNRTRGSVSGRSATCGAHADSETPCDSRPAKQVSPNEGAPASVTPKTRREFSGDGYLESQPTEEESKSPPSGRSRRRSTRHSSRRSSRKSKDMESEKSEWFLLPEDLEKAMMSASVDAISGDMLSQSIFSLFAGEGANQ